MIAGLLLPPWLRWAALAALLGVAAAGGAWITHALDTAQLERIKNQCAQQQAQVAAVATAAAQQAAATASKQTQITQRADHDYQTRRNALATRLAGDGMRDRSASICSRELPAFAADTSQPHAAAADAALSADGFTPDMASACALTTLQLLDLQATAVQLGLAVPP